MTLTRRSDYLIEKYINDRNDRISFLIEHPEGCIEKIRKTVDSLHRIFAAIEPSEDQILNFARRWGLLQKHSESDVPGIQGLRQTSLHGEPLLLWYVEICRMRCAVEILDAIKPRRANRNILEKMLSWSADLLRLTYTNVDMPSAQLGIINEVVVDIAPEQQLLAIDPANDDLIENQDPFPLTQRVFPPARLELYARLLLHQWINNRLASETMIAVKLDRHLLISKLHHQPRGLLGEMWLQLAYELSKPAKTSPQEAQYCVVCHKPLIHATRRSTKYCGAACKKRAMRANAKMRNSPNASETVEGTPSMV